MEVMPGTPEHMAAVRQSKMVAMEVIRQNRESCRRQLESATEHMSHSARMRRCRFFHKGDIARVCRVCNFPAEDEANKREAKAKATCSTKQGVVRRGAVGSQPQPLHEGLVAQSGGPRQSRG